MTKPILRSLWKIFNRLPDMQGESEEEKLRKIEMIGNLYDVTFLALCVQKLE